MSRQAIASGGVLPATATLALLAAAATGVQVGASLVLSRFVIGQTGPASLALMRYAIGFLCLLPAALLLAPAGGRRLFAPRDLLPIALLGITQFGIVVALLNYAVQLIPAGRAALLFATFPLQTMVLAALTGREAPSWAKALGIGLTILGVGLTLGEGALLPGEAPGHWLGDLLALASAFAGALCSVLYRPYLQRYRPLSVGAFAMLASVAFLAVPAAGEGFFVALPHFTTGGWLTVLAIGIGSGAGYFLWLWALRHASPTRVTMYLALSPLTAAALGAVWLGEPLTWPFLAGLACVAAGLALAQRGPAG
ncbi:MAG TPA: DMT family transporter [Alphaproteobacteria bacterium]|nr:DMT family transporter [Alphaproteobacteria bacterium]